MMMPLPEILHNPQYDGTWDFSEGRPVAKPNAPAEIIAAIDQYGKNIDEVEAKLEKALSITGAHTFHEILPE